MMMDLRSVVLCSFLMSAPANELSITASPCVEPFNHESAAQSINPQ